MLSKRILGFWGFFDICLLAAGIICLVFAVVWNHSGDPLRHLVIDNNYLHAGLALGSMFLVTFVFSIVAIAQPNNVILPLALLNWALIADTLAVVVVGTMIWWATLRERDNFNAAFGKASTDVRLTIQDQLRCCGYFATNDSALVNEGFCSAVNNATQPCVGPITSFADVTLNDIFTSTYGFAAVLIGLFLATLCIIKKRQEVERFKRIDEKQGKVAFV